MTRLEPGTSQICLPSQSQFNLLSLLCLSLGAESCDTPRRGLAGFVSLHTLNLTFCPCSV